MRAGARVPTGTVFGGLRGDEGTFCGLPCAVQADCDAGFFDLDGNPNDCECHYLSATDFPGPDVPSDPQALDVNCDGVDGEVGNAVFVAKNGDDANPGTREAPKRTIQAGIDAAALAGLRDVYMATGVYQEAVVLARDVGVYGGYSSDFRVRDLARYETAILAPMPSDAIPGAVNGLGGTGGPGALGGAGGGPYNPPTPTDPSFRGGKGGQGGRGGHGGGGGGGCGGPSYGVFATGVSGAAIQAWKTDNTLQVSGAGGSGGHGGFSLGEPGGDGLDGSIAATNF